MTATAHCNAIREEIFQTKRSLVVEETEDKRFSIIRGVRVMNSVSKNGGQYKPQAISDVARICERLRVSLEHTDKQTQRKYVDRSGQLRQPRVVSEGVDADWWINKGFAYHDQIVNDAVHCPENVMLSIQIPENAWVGEDHRLNGGGYIIEGVKSMDDCAIVADGGTTLALNESLNSDGSTNKTDDDEGFTMADQQAVNEAATQAAQRAVTEADQRRQVNEKIDGLEKQIIAVTAERDSIAEKLKTAEGQLAKRDRVSAIIKEASELELDITIDQATRWCDLPPEACTAEIKERLQLSGINGGENNQRRQDNNSAPSAAGPQQNSNNKAQQPDQFAFLD